MTVWSPESSELVDAAYREKYARFASYVAPMLTGQAQATTLRLVPEEPGR